MQGKMAFLGLYVCPFWDSDGGPRWLGMMDMQIPDRYEISGSRKLDSGVIFGVEYLILATKTNMLGKQLFFGFMCGRFGALLGRSDCWEW